MTKQLASVGALCVALALPAQAQNAEEAYQINLAADVALRTNEKCVVFSERDRRVLDAWRRMTNDITEQLLSANGSDRVAILTPWFEKVDQESCGELAADEVFTGNFVTPPRRLLASTWGAWVFAQPDLSRECIFILDQQRRLAELRAAASEYLSSYDDGARGEINAVAQSMGGSVQAMCGSDLFAPLSESVSAITYGNRNYGTFTYTHAATGFYDGSSTPFNVSGPRFVEPTTPDEDVTGTFAGRSVLSFGVWGKDAEYRFGALISSNDFFEDASDYAAVEIHAYVPLDGEWAPLGSWMLDETEPNSVDAKQRESTRMFVAEGADLDAILSLPEEAILWPTVHRRGDGTPSQMQAKLKTTGSEKWPRIGDMVRAFGHLSRAPFLPDPS